MKINKIFQGREDFNVQLSLCPQTNKLKPEWITVTPTSICKIALLHRYSNFSTVFIIIIIVNASGVGQC